VEDLRSIELQSSSCPLCTLQYRREEKIYYEDAHVVVVDAKTKKGHAKRIMIVLRSHIASIPEEYQCKLIEKFADVVMPEFAEENEFYIYGTMQTVKDHWHKICCSRNERADDFQELFGKPRSDLIRVPVLKKEN
jgi:hypothetical protein